MQTRRIMTAYVAGALVAVSTALVGAEPVGRRSAPDREQRIRAFSAENPGAAIQRGRSGIKRVWGGSFSRGASARDSARRFLQAHSDMFGVPANELVPDAAAGPVAPVRTQAIGYDRTTGKYRFTAVRYEQSRDGVPVYGASITLLVRNDADHPLVLANPDVRELGAFRVPNEARIRAIAPASRQAALNHVDLMSEVAGPGEVVETGRVIYAGADDEIVAPALADEVIVRKGPDAWRVITDAATGEILHQEHLICFVDVTGTVSGLVTDGIGSDQCAPEVVKRLPYLEVYANGTSAFTDANGNFLIPYGGTGTVSVTTDLWGRWFEVFSHAGGNASITEIVNPFGPADLLFNASNTEFVRAQVNAYHSANAIRDFVLRYQPDYPMLTETLPVHVNRNDGFCPGNAWYSTTEQSINFCLSGSGYPNSAAASTIYHEFGHHLVAAAGSGQQEYGEGMGDVMSILLLDDPRLSPGAYGECSSAVRTADNDCQYDADACSSCGDGAHQCAQLLSGAVWSLRNELRNTHPADYRDILADLAINAMLLHTGHRIDPSIVIDYLTIDDDNGNILDGTPNKAEILAAFGAHGLDAPAIAFEFPFGRPDLISPSGTSAIRVEMRGIIDAPRAGTGTLHLSATGEPGTFTAVPMVEVSANVYDAVFPAGSCALRWHYYVRAESVGGSVETYPLDAPSTTFEAVIAEDDTELFADTFTTDRGWLVTNLGGPHDGPWERGISLGPWDIDGDDYAYLTGNTSVLGGSDVDAGSTTLTSPVIDARSPMPVLSYYRWFYAPHANAEDTFRVEISDDGGASWTTVEVISPNSPEADGEWWYAEHRIADFIAVTESFRVRFTATDLLFDNPVEAAVDRVVVTGYSCDPACPADLDGNGEVSFSDLTALLSVWGPCGGCPADFDVNGVVGFGDLTALLNAWGPCD